ncbi:sulfotransferase family 2 domain-containing protein [Pikeienuella sp. HZG-20]|uniref:sulfotransferase family 2 domain-containing protein n=1 Tax=Paludibacillus litoralis TaxID=3133267 RepID=UPI0030EDEBAB
MVGSLLFTPVVTMPLFKFENSLYYYAHVPKCGGSSVNMYIKERFGALAFYDSNFIQSGHNRERQWTRSSPQHVDCESMERLIPLHFFDWTFSVVRHPVSRIVSTFHFQKEVERSIPENIGFSEWIENIDHQELYFKYDNHILPMNRIVPDRSMIFHLEHGLDSLIIWLDMITGRQDAPRAFAEVNRRGAYTKKRGPLSRNIEPSSKDLDRIAALYAEDFERFGYDLNDPKPKASAPVISPEFIAAREADIKRMNAPLARLSRKIRRRISKSLNS